MVVAVLLYAAPIWACDQKELLDKTQDVFLRRLLNLPRNLKKTSLPEGYLSYNLPFIVKRHIAQLRVLYTFFRENHKNIFGEAELLYERKTFISKQDNRFPDTVEDILTNYITGREFLLDYLGFTRQFRTDNPTLSRQDIMESDQNTEVKDSGNLSREGETAGSGETTAPLAGVLLQLATLLTQAKVSDGAAAALPPFDGTYSAHQFFQAFDRKMDDAHVDAPEKLLRLPNYLTRQPLEHFRKLRLAAQDYFQVRQILLDLYPESSEASFAKYFAMKLTGQADLETYYREKTAMGLQLGLPQKVILETLTEGLPFSDQRLVRVVPPESLGEWFRLAQRIHGPSMPTARHREDQPPTMSGPYPSTPRRTGAWTAPPPPSNCAVNVYNKFIPEYARLRTPLNNLLKKDVVWVWDEAFQKAFISLKESLTQHPILHLYKEGLPCQVYCDASTLGIAGILKQVHPDGNVYPVQFFSRTLRSHERNYSISELECLAIVESVEKFRIYLMGRKFTIFSDHHALQWLKTIKNPSGRLFRWSLRLSSYEYETHPLLRPINLLHRESLSLTIDHNGLHTVSRKVHAQYNHPGISQMTRLISAQYYWQGMSKDITQKVKTCPTCQLTKRPLGPTYGELGQPPEAKGPFDLLFLDTIAGFAKYGNTKTYLHVVVDHFSRYTWTFPSKSTSITIYQQVIKRVLQDGSPKRLLMDRAPAFTSPKFSSFLLNRNIHPLHSTSNNPQANGLCERLNATLTGKLRLLHLENPKIAWTKMCQKKLLYLSVGLTYCFRRLGSLVARRPWWFIIAPVIFTVLTSIWCINVEFDGDTVKLFGPSGSSYHRVRKLILHNFPLSKQEHYDIGRETKFISGYGRLLVETLDGGSLFRHHIVDEIFKIDKIVRSMAITDPKGKRWDYESLCARYYGACFVNPTIHLAEHLGEILSGEFKIKYPLELSKDQLQFHYYGATLGGVTLNSEGHVINATKAQLVYFLDNVDPEKEALITTWEHSFLDLIDQTPLQYLRVYPLVTKPWLGVFGCISSFMGVIAGSGICLLAGLSYPPINFGVPFLLLAIGIDDTFIFLAAWRTTDPKDSVEKRLAESYEHSAVSVTLTSMTNCASFLACTTMPYMATRIFGINAFISCVLVYIYQLTFIGGIIALTGRREAAGYHGFFPWVQVKKEPGIFQSKIN
ncbi:hypothetical protein LAZ67_6002591 [Cordylochernes scorpioides]|uniref:Uncharacterized protein n=1 Tax=Cordylochernes scorpioides TaxID=51811 RepID=A0ABY6KN16_9ARAC|nr:hypothetical protein LAZ67_6002591 [Cordylochernes scorpioides]